MALKLQMAEAALDHMNTYYANEIMQIDAYTRLKEKYERMAKNAYKKLLEGEAEPADFLPRYRQMLRELVTVRRAALQRLKKEQLYSDELIRNKEWELDLEEARLNES
jgi:CPA1 family monovalent cation:H+ antiporter